MIGDDAVGEVERGEIWEENESGEIAEGGGKVEVQDGTTLLLLLD